MMNGREIAAASGRRRLALGLGLLLPLLGLACAGTGASAPRADGLADARRACSPRSDVPGVRNFGQVSDVLYRGGQPTADGFAGLKALGIRTVVDLRNERHDEPPEELGLRYVHIPMSAGRIRDRDVATFLRTVRDPANQPVFVHCRRGADRTGCLVGAYRIVEQGWTARQARAELGRFRFNPWFMNIPAYLSRLDVDQMHARLSAHDAGLIATAEPAARGTGVPPVLATR